MIMVQVEEVLVEQDFQHQELVEQDQILDQAQT